MKNNEEVINMLKKYKQEHVINLLNQLEVTKKEELIEQIKNIDLDMVMKLYEATKNKLNKDDNKIEYIKYLDKSDLDKQQKENFDKLGEEVIKNAEYAVVTMAGRSRNKTRTFRAKGNL